MTTLTRSQDPTRRAAFAIGVLYLITFIGSIGAAILLGPLNSDPTFTLDTVPGGDIRLAAVLELVNVIACFGTAVAAFSVIRRVHESLAIGFVATRLFEAATLMVGVIAILALVTVRETSASAAAVAPALVAIRFWSLVVGPNMAAFNALMFATALFRGRLVPRAIPALGIFGAPLLISFVVATILGATGAGTIWQGIAVAPFFIWELVIGLWLTFKGFDRSAPVVAASTVAASTAPTQSAITTAAGAA
jgi:hypothetical protein